MAPKNVACAGHQGYAKQDHHRNGDQAAQRPHVICSICGHQFGYNFKGGLFDPRFGGYGGKWLGWG